MPHNGNPLAQLAWAALASFAGALTALSAQPFKDMTKGEITLALVTGTSFAFFVGPLVYAKIFGQPTEVQMTDIRIMGAVLYLMATGSNILIPIAVKWLGGFLGIKHGENGK